MQVLFILCLLFLNFTYGVFWIYSFYILCSPKSFSTSILCLEMAICLLISDCYYCFIYLSNGFISTLSLNMSRIYWDTMWFRAITFFKSLTNFLRIGIEYAFFLSWFEMVSFKYTKFLCVNFLTIVCLKFYESIYSCTIPTLLINYVILLNKCNSFSFIFKLALMFSPIYFSTLILKYIW